MRLASARALASILTLAAIGCDSGTSPSSSSTFSTTFTGPLVVTSTTSTTTCVSTRALNGTLRMTLGSSSSGAGNSGTAVTSGTIEETSVNPAGFCATMASPVSLNGTRPVTGTAGTLTFSSATTSTAPAGGFGGSLTCTDTMSFSGVLARGNVTGTLTYSTLCQGTTGFSTINSSGTTSIPVTLR